MKGLGQDRRCGLCGHGGGLGQRARQGEGVRVGGGLFAGSSSPVPAVVGVRSVYRGTRTRTQPGAARAVQVLGCILAASRVQQGHQRDEPTAESLQRDEYAVR